MTASPLLLHDALPLVTDLQRWFELDRQCPDHGARVEFVE